MSENNEDSSKGRWVAASDLAKFASAVLISVGTPSDIANYVADSLVGNNLRGTDSHGIMQLPGYLEEIESGLITPESRVQVETDEGVLIQLDAGNGIGIYALHQAGIVALERARDAGASAVFLNNCSHTGRIGEVAEQAAEQGFYLQIFGGGAREKWPSVAPVGGCSAVLSTNPYAFAMPGADHGAVVCDFATSAVSEGQVMTALNAQRDLPEACIVDKHGKTSCEPRDYVAGGALLPAAGQKGYGMALIAEMFGEAVLHSQPDMGWVLIAIDIRKLCTTDDYNQRVNVLLSDVKDSTPLPGLEEVMLPGERGRRTKEQRAKTGIWTPHIVCEQLNAMAEKHALPGI